MNLQTKRQKKSGFTLAEVLIVIGIIGTVANLTIPTLVSSVQESQYRAGYKKNFAVFSQVFLKIREESCGGNIPNCFAGSSSAPSEAFNNALASYLKVNKKCSGTGTYGGSGSGVTTGGCYHHGSAVKNYYGNTGGWPTETFGNPGMILDDGTMIYVNFLSSGCTSTPTGATFSNRCAGIAFDTNGFKGPNATGKDIHIVSLTSTGIVPTGTLGYTMNLCPPAGDSVATSDTSAGQGCGYYYLSQ